MKVAIRMPVCPADNNTARGRPTTEDDDGPVEHRQAQPRQGSYPNQRSCGRRPGLIAHEALAHQREYHWRAEDDDQSADAVQQATKGPFWIRRENTPTEIGEADDKQPQVPKRPSLVWISCRAAAKRANEATPRQKKASDINQPK